MQFTYDINSDQVDKALANFQAALADQRPALQAIADDFRALLARQFATEGRAEGTPWPPRLSAHRRGTGVSPLSTRQMRVPRIGGEGASLLLVRTGALRDSLIEADAPDHVEEFDATSLTFGTRVPYALFHQFGTRRLPARPLIVLSGESAERWVEVIRSGINDRSVLRRESQLR